MFNTNIVVIYGKKGSGKDTAAQFILNKYAKSRRISFADTLKHLAWVLFHHKVQDPTLIFGDVDQKERPIEGWEIPKHTRKKLKTKNQFWTGRKLLQWLGTDVLRKDAGYYGIWVERAITVMSEIIAGNQKAKETSQVVSPLVVTDCRFANEYKALETLGLYSKVFFVKITRDSVVDNSDSKHSSEQGIKEFECDYEISNNGTLDDLEVSMLEFCDRFNIEGDKDHSKLEKVYERESKRESK